MAFWSSTQQEMGFTPKQTWIPVARGASDVSYFLDRLHAGLDSEMSARQAGEATEVLLAAYKSAAVKSTIKLPLTDG